MPPIRFELHASRPRRTSGPTKSWARRARPCSDTDTTLISFSGNARVDVLQTRDGHRCFLNAGRSGRRRRGEAYASWQTARRSSSPVAGRGCATSTAAARSTSPLRDFYYHNPATSPTPVDPNRTRLGRLRGLRPVRAPPGATPAERPVTRAIDLDGDGNMDLLQTGGDFVTWRNLGDRAGRRRSGKRAATRSERADWPDVSFDDPGGHHR